MKKVGDKIGVIVIGNHVQSLGIIRDLGRRGIPVYLLNDKSLCIGRFSKYIHRFIKCPDLNDEKSFLDFIINLAHEENVTSNILLPTNDAGVYILSKHKKRLENHYKVPTPVWDITKFAYDKKLTYSLAEKNNIPIPKTFYPENVESLDDIVSALKFPVIIKPTVMHRFYKKTKTKVLKAKNPKELKKAYINAASIIDPSEIMVQEVIPGGPDQLYSFCSFFKKGEVIGSCMGRRNRQRPMDFGHGTTFAESVHIPELEELGTLLLNSIKYYGLSEIEFKFDSRDGKFKLLEINPRTWLWHTLAIRCGVDMLHFLYMDMIGEEIDKTASFKEGVKWLHIYTDLGVSIGEMLKGNLKLHDYLSSIKGEKEFAVFSLDDPLPFIMETLLLPYLMLTR